jgi:putative membrane protein
MHIASNVLVVLVALAHLYFLALEMFLWTRPLGLRTFGMTQEFANSTAVLAANQGLYNGFLAAGLLWGLLAGRHGRAIKLFFLACIVIAGVYGGVTAKTTILYVQALPAAIALALVLAFAPAESRR